MSKLFQSIISLFNKAQQLLSHILDINRKETHIILVSEDGEILKESVVKDTSLESASLTLLKLAVKGCAYLLTFKLIAEAPIAIMLLVEAYFVYKFLVWICNKVIHTAFSEG